MNSCCWWVLLQCPALCKAKARDNKVGQAGCYARPSTANHPQPPTSAVSTREQVSTHPPLPSSPIEEPLSCSLPCPIPCLVHAAGSNGGSHMTPGAMHTDHCQQGAAAAADAAAGRPCWAQSLAYERTGYRGSLLISPGRRAPQAAGRDATASGGAGAPASCGWRGWPPAWRCAARAPPAARLPRGDAAMRASH